MDWCDLRCASAFSRAAGLRSFSARVTDNFLFSSARPKVKWPWLVFFAAPNSGLLMTADKRLVFGRFQCEWVVYYPVPPKAS